MKEGEAHESTSRQPGLDNLPGAHITQLKKFFSLLVVLSPRSLLCFSKAPEEALQHFPLGLPQEAMPCHQHSGAQGMI